MDLSDVEFLYINETSSKKGHSYVTLVCDQDRRIIFVCEGKSSETVYRLEAHNGKRENMGSSVVTSERRTPPGCAGTPSNPESSTTRSMLWLITKATDNIARLVVESQAIKVRTRHLTRMNVSKLSEEQLRTPECSVKDYRELAENYRFKNIFSNIYKQYNKESA